MHSRWKGIACLFLFAPLSLAAQLNPPSLEEIWKKGKYSGSGARGFTALNDGESYVQIDLDTVNKVQELNRYSIKEGKRLETLLTNADLRTGKGDKLDISAFRFSDDENKIMFLTDIRYIYRHSFEAVYHVFDRKTKDVFHSPRSVRYAEFAPSGNLVAYVYQNNLYYQNLVNGEETVVTVDGKENTIINGAVDWVYEEEFSMSRGFEWSPDGNYLAFYRFDESAVKEFSMDRFGGNLYPSQEKWRYPKAGEANSLVEVYIYNLSTNQKKRCDLGANTDIYIPRIKWTDMPGTLSVQRLNRLQNHWEILFADAETGATGVMYEEKNAAYIDVTDLDFHTGSFIFNSERSGYNHLYRFDHRIKELKAITSGNWDVDQYYGFDPVKKVVYFSAADETAIRRNIYSMPLSGGKMTKLSDKKGWNSASFTRGHKYFLHGFSSATEPPVFTLCKADGKVIRILEENKELKATLKQTQMGSIEFNQLTTDSGITLNYFMIKPANFDPNKKYPMLMYVYGGPGSQTVKDQWGGSYYMWFNYLASKGYIVVSVDNRGTGFRGEQFKKITYLQMGKYEIEDQIAAARTLGKLSYVDAGRIGIWGWSFGGYMSSLGISKGADVFKAAVAVAPVTNWRYYDNIYTERFMRTPQENGASYDANSPINHVDKIKGAYLLIHGTADDNVHLQNSVEMVDALIKRNIPFDSEFYPEKNHGIGGGNTRLHLFTRISGFLFENL